ncbi:MAG: hypothetical protein R3345_13835, partial [Fulvivirga sp.]|nr:hypothetical protein [Fulvivirga sp.]
SLKNDTQIKQELIFEIPHSTKEFTLNDRWVEEHKAFLVRHCRCIDAGYNPVYKGFITGKKTSENSWSIEVQVKIQGNDSGEIYQYNYSGKAAIK